jgi:CARDB
VPILAFFDDDEALAPEERPSSRRYEGSGGSPYMLRRIVGVGLLILILVLLLLGIRGCLNARAERGLENYVSDAGAIVQDSAQLSDRFFERLENPENLDAMAFEQQVAADRGTAETLVDRVEGLDVPGDLEGEHGQMLQAFQLRAEAMTGISNQIGTALGENTGQTQAEDAINAIAGYMRWFLASDVLYGISKDETNEVLADEDIEGHLPDDRFLPDPPTPWIDPEELRSTLTGVATGTGQARPGVHGTAMVGASINGIPLVDGGAVTVSGGAPYTLTAEVQNQGESAESGLPVTYRMSGGLSGEGEGQIDRIAVGDTVQVDIEIEPAPQSGDTGEIEVTVEPVIEEQLTDNNTITSTVTFE